MEEEGGGGIVLASSWCHAQILVCFGVPYLRVLEKTSITDSSRTSTESGAG